MKDIDCCFCKLDLDKSPTKIYDFGKWVLLANLKQFLPGVCLLVSKQHKEGITSLDDDEIVEVHRILKLIERVLSVSFKPDWFNYLQTNNSVRHLHFHVIPRYEKEVMFFEESFVDPNFNGMPVENDRCLSKVKMDRLVSKIKENIENELVSLDIVT